MAQAPIPTDLPPYPISTTSAGVHSGLPPYLLAPDQLAFAVNVTHRGGYPTTRPALLKLQLDYHSDAVRTALQAIFQGAAFYRSFGNNPNCLVASVGGRIFRFAVQNNHAQVDEITPFLSDGVTLDRNDPTVPQAWLAQGQDFMVINDGQGLPYFFNGAACRRSAGGKGQELPAGRQTLYVNGRFVTVLADPEAGGQSYIASDLVYNTNSGTPAYNYRDSILRTTDNTAIQNGQAFAVPINSGPITALWSTAVSDTSLGQGPLQIGTPGGIYSVNLPLDATLWTMAQQPTQIVALPSAGPVGQDAVTNVNGDAWYRAYDGLHSFVIARRDFNTWVQTPLSYEMQRVLPFDTQSQLPQVSVVQFNNRLLCTCSPYRVASRGIAYRGLVALDFNNISSLTTRSQPAYDGLWTGLPILKLVKGTFAGIERLFAFALDLQGDLCLYELATDEGAYFDFDGFGQVPIESWIESGALYGRESDPTTISQPFKRIESGDLFLQNLLGPATGTHPGRISFNIQYRSDQWPCWVDWRTFSLCAQSCQPPQVPCAQPQTVKEQYATFKRLPQPNDVCNPVTGSMHRMGYLFQVRIQWTGHATLHRFNLWATKMQAVRNVVCGDEACKLLTACCDNLFTYNIEPAVCAIVITQQPMRADVLEWDTDSDAATFDTDASSTIHVTDL